MALEDLRKKIYKPGAEFGERLKPSTVFEPGAKKEQVQKTTEWQEPKPKKPFLTAKQKKYFLIVSIVLFVLLAGLVVFIYWRSRNYFDKTLVDLNISGPERIVSGENATYAVKCKNNTKTVLQKVQLIFYWPEGTSSQDPSFNLTETVSLSDITPAGQIEIPFAARLIGPKESQKQIKAKLSYEPMKINAEFTNTADFNILIISTPLALNFEFPDEVVNGQSMTISLRYLNSSSDLFSDLMIKVEYPNGFTVSSSYPEPQENLWQIGDLQSNQEKKILISGTIEGEQNENKSFNGYLGVMQDNVFVPYAVATKAAHISQPILSLVQTLNNSADYAANLGDTLNYKIKYQNNGDISLPSVQITVKLEGDVLDLTFLDLKQKGNFNSVTNAIIWDQSIAPELVMLDPGQSGEMLFSVKAKDKIVLKGLNETNFTITSTAKIESLNVPLSLNGRQVSGESKLITKLNSYLTLDAKGYFQDSLLPNSGPLPPKVGQTTTYTIYWQITNFSNALKNVRVETVLPPYVEWLNKSKPADAALQYDVLSRKLTWSIGDLDSAVGFLRPAEFAVFQVGLTPSITQFGQAVELLRTSTIFGQDDFTNNNLQASDRPVKTDSLDDASVSAEKGRVSQ